jgi:hypothetical protein
VRVTEERTLVPVISVDTKHRELFGELMNGPGVGVLGGAGAGRHARFPSRAKRVPSDASVRRHFQGKAIPNGAYDLARNKGWGKLGPVDGGFGGGGGGGGGSLAATASRMGVASTLTRAAPSVLMRAARRLVIDGPAVVARPSRVATD